MPSTQDNSPDDTNPTETCLGGPLNDHLLAKSKANQTGNYRCNAERVLTEFLDWAEEHGVETFDALAVSSGACFAGVNFAAMGIFAPAETIYSQSRSSALQRLSRSSMRHLVPRTDSVRKVEQTAVRGLLDDVVKDIINDVFEIGEKTIDRVSRRRSIEATAEPDQRLLEFPVLQDECRRRPRSSSEESRRRVLVAHELVFAPLAGGGHAVLQQKPEREIPEQRYCLSRRDIREVVD